MPTAQQHTRQIVRQTGKVAAVRRWPTLAFVSPFGPHTHTHTYSRVRNPNPRGRGARVYFTFRLGSWAPRARTDSPGRRDANLQTNTPLRLSIGAYRTTVATLSSTNTCLPSSSSLHSRQASRSGKPSVHTHTRTHTNVKGSQRTQGGPIQCPGRVTWTPTWWERATCRLPPSSDTRAAFGPRARASL